MTNEDVVKRLDTVIALLRLAHRDTLDAALVDIRGDKTNAAVLAQVGSDWVGTTKLQASVAKKSGAATRTVRDRLADLVKVGLIEKRGAGSATEYRAGDLL